MNRILTSFPNRLLAAATGDSRRKTGAYRTLLSLFALTFLILFSLTSCASGTSGNEGATKATSKDGKVEMVRIGEGGLATWAFTPASPRPESAPVVLFLHGYRATDPYAYGGWIDHIVRSGNIVLFPIFEEDRDSPAERSMDNAIEGAKRALQKLKSDGPVKPDTSRFAIVGHSFGGGLSTVIAARAKDVGLPTPKAVMAVQPGWQGDADDFPAKYLSSMPGSVLLMVVEGDKDQFEDSRVSETILERTSNVPKDRKRLLVIHTNEEQGDPGLADHYAPLSPNDEYKLEATTRRQERRKNIVSFVMGIRDGETSSLDRKGFWKLFDTLTDSAFRNGGIERAVDSVQGGAGPRVTVE